MAEVTGMTPDRINQEITNVKSYVDGGLSEKADKSQVTSDLSKKADKTYVDGGLSEKADKSQVTSDLSKKADKTYVDGGLSEKADKSQVTSDLSKKADKTYVDDATSKVDGTNSGANKFVKLNSEGRLFITTASITEKGDPANKSYVDSMVDAKADKTYVDSLAPLKSFVGSGSPEGKIKAPVGTIYTDTSATCGAIRWIKTRGSESTGWEVVYGNTGLRDITGLIDGDAGDGTVRIQRIGNVVTLSLNSIPIPNAGSFVIFRNLIPLGFQSSFSFQHFGVSKPGSDYASGPFRVGRGGDLIIYRSTGEIQTHSTATYTSDTPWPTTLPGTPA